MFITALAPKNLFYDYNFESCWQWKGTKNKSRAIISRKKVIIPSNTCTSTATVEKSILRSLNRFSSNHGWKHSKNSSFEGKKKKKTHIQLGKFVKSRPRSLWLLLSRLHDRKNFVWKKILGLKLKLDFIDFPEEQKRFLFLICDVERFKREYLTKVCSFVVILIEIVVKMILIFSAISYKIISCLKKKLLFLKNCEFVFIFPINMWWIFNPFPNTSFILLRVRPRPANRQ